MDSEGDHFEVESTVQVDGCNNILQRQYNTFDSSYEWHPIVRAAARE
jgi:hypothetical protein